MNIRDYNLFPLDLKWKIYFINNSHQLYFKIGFIKLYLELM
jgi:hypothetical protein